MKILVIPEDPTYNGYILKPLVARMLREAGRPNAKVRILTDPYAQGYAMIKERILDICERYRHFDLLLFLPDQDCRDRTPELHNLEQRATATQVRLLTCAAVQEVEAWLLAGHIEKLDSGWSDIRSECDLKERHFHRFINKYGDNSAGQGRERLMRETLQNFTGLLSHCPELRMLQARIENAVAEFQ